MWITFIRLLHTKKPWHIRDEKLHRAYLKFHVSFLNGNWGAWQCARGEKKLQQMLKEVEWFRPVNEILNACQSNKKLRQPTRNGMSERSDFALSPMLLASHTIIVNLRSFRIPLFTSCARIYYSLWFSRFIRAIHWTQSQNKNECQILWYI